MHGPQLVQYQPYVRLKPRNRMIESAHDRGNNVHIVVNRADIELHPTHLFGEKIKRHGS